MKTFSVKPGEIDKKWVVIDASGLVVGRLASIVAMRLRGISSAITPQARLPVVGDARDDYGLSRLWFEYQLNQSTSANRRAIISGPRTAR